MQTLGTPPKADAGDRSIYAAAIALSLLLSAWTSYAQFIPNSDAAIYLRAAELFSAGEWREAIAIYRWPFLSLAIAAVMTVSGLDALPAAHVLNALTYVLLIVSFMALVTRLADGGRIVLACAAFVVLLHPRTLQMRGAVIRDNAFFALLLLALYFVVRDQQTASYRNKIVAAAAVLGAALFRIEAMFFAVLIPGYYLFAQASTRRGRLKVTAGMMLIFLLAIPAYIAWVGLHEWLLVPGFDISSAFGSRWQTFQVRVERLETSFDHSDRYIAYVGATLTMGVVALVRALTLPYAILTGIALWRPGLVPEGPRRFALWFGGWQAGLVVAFALMSGFATARHAMMFMFMMTIPVILAAASLFRAGMPGTRAAQGGLAAAAIALVGAAIVYFPRPAQTQYVIQAAAWIRTNVPPSALVITNDAMVGYYSGRRYDTQVLVRGPRLFDYEMDRSDYALITVSRGGVPNYIKQRKGAKLIGTIAQSGRHTVLAYRLR